MSNLPTALEIKDRPSLARDLPLDALQAILATCGEQSAVLTSARSIINSSIAERLNADITGAYLAKGVDTGVVHLDRDGLDIVVDRSKTVTWDQAKLAKAVADITAAGDDPTEYVRISYSVSEAAYVAWPSMIKNVFEPARTVKPGNPTIKLVTPEAKAA